MANLADIAVRFWDELVSRSSGPLAFRFLPPSAPAPPDTVPDLLGSWPSDQALREWSSRPIGDIRPPHDG